MVKNRHIRFYCSCLVHVIIDGELEQKIFYRVTIERVCIVYDYIHVYGYAHASTNRNQTFSTSYWHFYFFDLPQ